MSLTVGEACCVNTIVSHLLPTVDDPTPATDDLVIDALAILADKAHAKLGAGVNGAQVRAAWARRA